MDPYEGVSYVNGSSAEHGARSTFPPIDHPQAQRSQRQRVSFQTIDEQSVSGSSTFHSPASPLFASQSGLAPRPASFSYKAQEAAPTERKGSSQRSSMTYPATSGGPVPPPNFPKRSFSARVRGVPTEIEGLLNGYEPSSTADRHDLEPHSQRLQESDSRNSDVPSSLGIGSTVNSHKPQNDRNGPLGTQEPATRRPNHGTTPDRNVSLTARSVSLYGREWAPDRSPLQKLELTLQGISLDEKRAQAEEADISMREARATDTQRRTARKQDAISDTSPLETSDLGTDPLAEAGLAKSLSNKQTDQIRRSATLDSRRYKASKRERNGDNGGALEDQEQQYLPSSKGTGRRTTSSSRDPTVSFTPVVGREDEVEKRAGPSGSLESHRFGSDEVQLPDERLQPARGGVAEKTGAKRLLQGRNERVTKDDDSYGVLRGSPPHATRHNEGQTVIEADVGAAARPLPYTPTSKASSSSCARLARAEIDLDQLMRLAAHRDVAAGRSNKGSKRTKNARDPERQDPLSDVSLMGTHRSEGNGTIHSDHLHLSPSDPDHIPDAQRAQPHYSPARPYLKQRSGQKPHRRMLWRKKFGVLDGSGSDSSTSPAVSSLRTDVLPYSYSCPHLSQHSIDNPFHICPPKSDKELTRSMRSVGIRPVAGPSTFTPPLYLKCGPLLRFLGIHQNPSASVDSPLDDGTAEHREVWKGSVMIVTTDSDSSYVVPPTLRLFAQPMTLLPLPSAEIYDEAVGRPPDNVDSIAGLRKMSRTGSVLYVRPVEDLDEEVDLSWIEDDGGLFETVRSRVGAHLPKNDGTSSRLRSWPDEQDRLGPVDGERLGKFKEVQGFRLHSERGVTFWRFAIEVELSRQQARIAYRINQGPAIGFWVPAEGETMNVMFHSCNGFSLNVNPDQFSGPDPMWRDVLNAHQTQPFHAMIGGGDQIYNDAVMKQSDEFQNWFKTKNPSHKHSMAFSADLHDELDTFYLERYSMWFSQGLFGMANAQIPMINIWDDHDIIDGFGSYPDHFMASPVFSGLGGIAFKHYLLFQHQSVATETSAEEPTWVLGSHWGPYIGELSRSVFLFLGRKVAFLGLDCRTERTRDEILSEETYALIFDRCRREIVKGETKHLLVLLGVPIAYPRLVWLETMLTSRLMDPVKALGRSGLLGGFTNKFDGGVEILDDLDDHWTAKNHKVERNWFVRELQQLAAEKSVRVIILGGDVHLAAIGQFYSNPRLEIPKDEDHRYMPNIISSAIVNAPPPEMLGDVLNKRNKVHHLDLDTDEDMIPLFSHDVDGKPRNNKRLLPRRNWCSLREYRPGTTPPPTPPTEIERHSPESIAQQLRPTSTMRRSMSLSRKDVHPAKLFRRFSRRGGGSGRGSSTEMYDEEESGQSAVRTRPGPAAGSYFPSPSVDHSEDSPGELYVHRPSAFHRQPTELLESKRGGGNNSHHRHHHGHINLQDGLDIALHVEVNQKDPAGVTVPYRLLVPALHYSYQVNNRDDDVKEDDRVDLPSQHDYEHEDEYRNDRRSQPLQPVQPQQQRRGWFRWAKRRSISQPGTGSTAPYYDEDDEDNVVAKTAMSNQRYQQSQITDDDHHHHRHEQYDETEEEEEEERGANSFRTGQSSRTSSSASLS